MKRSRTPESLEALLASVKVSLQSVDRADLVKAQCELKELMRDVKKRVRLQGDDRLLEAMVRAAKLAAKSKLDENTIRRFLESMTIKIHLQTDDIDHSDNSMEGSARGTWGFWGQTYDFSASVTDTEGDETGMIEIEGLAFFAEDDLSECGFESDLAVADWIHYANMDISEADGIRMAVAGMRVLAQKQASGSCDIDVLGTVFKLMQEEAAKL
mmetsp:Transcript_28193/g.58522  ORF Transcript_28193/g.58522 Transcript_28193/m.58522 type:complete len:213 (-) Transcript_28193:131-769(-)